jgi:hypothetical protein
MNLLYAGKDDQGHELIIDMDQVTDIRRGIDSQSGQLFVVLTFISAGQDLKLYLKDVQAQRVWDWAFEQAMK